MKYLFCVLFLLAAVSSGEVLWSWSFDEIPTGWVANQYWDFADSGAHSYVESASLAHGGAEQNSEMLSDTLVIPAGVSMIAVYIYSNSNYHGWWSTGESECNLRARLGIVGGSMNTVEYESHYWGFDISIP